MKPRVQMNGLQQSVGGSVGTDSEVRAAKIDADGERVCRHVAVGVGNFSASQRSGKMPAGETAITFGGPLFGRGIRAR